MTAPNIPPRGHVTGPHMMEGGYGYPYGTLSTKGGSKKGGVMIINPYKISLIPSENVFDESGSSIGGVERVVLSSTIDDFTLELTRGDKNYKWHFSESAEEFSRLFERGREFRMQDAYSAISERLSSRTLGIYVAPERGIMLFPTQDGLNH